MNITKILIVEDDQSVRSALFRLLTDKLTANGCMVITAANGKDAIRSLAAHDWTVDAIILDVDMPYVDGEAVLREVRRMRPALERRIIVIGDTEGRPAFGNGVHILFPKAQHTAHDVIGLVLSLI